MTHRVVVIGAGMGGLAAAIDLASSGVDVTLLERAATPGGKMREVCVGGQGIDSGPTVFTMRWVFDALFEQAGTSLESQVSLAPCEVLARHAWRSGGPMDLFCDVDRTVEEIGNFSGAADAAAYRAFCARTARVFNALRDTYIKAPRPSPIDLVLRIGPHRLGTLLALGSFSAMWRSLTATFRDERLRQLFGRYATYCGSSPYVTPSTLLLVAHVEREGVWSVGGGMHQLARAMAITAGHVGAKLRYDAEVALIETASGAVSGVQLATGERLPCDAVVFNGDTAALGAGLLGEPAQAAVRPRKRSERSLSAVTWSMQAKASGFPLSHHNVFFSDDYRSEFSRLFDQHRLPLEPTVYVCAQDRSGQLVNEGTGDSVSERLLCLVNAPADGDSGPLPEHELARCEAAGFGLLSDCGLALERREVVRTTPAEFEALFPGTGGALYGSNLHGVMGSFRRPGSHSKTPGLYLAGGSVHPGAGVPMATLSGRLAAAALISDLARRKSSRGQAPASRTRA